MSPLSRGLLGEARSRLGPLRAVSSGGHLNAGGVSRFLLPTFLCGRQRKVSAAPHRGNANKPITKQGKAKNKERPKKPKKPTRAAGKNEEPKTKTLNQLPNAISRHRIKNRIIFANGSNTPNIRARM